MRDNLILENLGLVRAVIKAWKEHQDYEDMLQVGTIGLIKAADTYSDKKATRFSTYATYCIKNEIHKYHRYYRYKKRAGNTVSLNTKVGENKEDMLQDFIPSSVNVLDIVSDRLLVSKINEYTKPRSRRILHLYLAGYRKSEIARVEGITNEGVRQALKRAVHRLKRCGEI